MPVHPARGPNVFLLRFLEAVIDRVLTIVFAPLVLVGIHKCPRCRIRVRLAQALLLLTHPLRGIDGVDALRVRLEQVAHPAGLTPTLENDDG